MMHVNLVNEPRDSYYKKNGFFLKMEFLKTFQWQTEDRKRSSLKQSVVTWEREKPCCFVTSHLVTITGSLFKKNKENC